MNAMQCLPGTSNPQYKSFSNTSLNLINFDNFGSFRKYNTPVTPMSTSFQDSSDKSRITSWSNNYNMTRENHPADNESMPRNSLGERALRGSSHQNLENYYTLDNYMNESKRTFKMLQSQIGNYKRIKYFSSVNTGSNNSVCSITDKSSRGYIPISYYNEKSCSLVNDSSWGVPQGDSLRATINNDAQMEVIYTSNSSESCEPKQGRVYFKGVYSLVV